MAVNSKSNLFRKYFLVISMVIFLSFVILGGALLFFISNSWVEEKDLLLKENTESVAQVTSELVESGYMKENETGALILIYNTLSTLSTSVDADIYITNLKGDIIFCRDLISSSTIVAPGSCVIHNKYKVPETIIEETLEQGHYSDVNTFGGVFLSPHLIVTKAIYASGKCIGIVVAAQPVAALLGPYVISVLRMFAFASLLALAIAFLTVYFMIYKVTMPLRQMSRATKRYAAGDFSFRVDVKGDDELAELAQGFNAMAKELATLESSRRSFVANVSHELKTPMTTIGGFIDGMLDGTIEEERRPHYLKIVSDEIKRLSRLVTGMLNMSKIEAGELKLNPTEFDLRSLIFNSLLAFEQLIEQKSIDIKGLDRMESLPISADKDMIAQVVYNLIDNAVKFTPQGGYIDFEAKIPKDKNKLSVSITNSGPGIDPEELGKVFDRFYKADKARSFDSKSAGLGLFLVKSILDLHGGSIEVESEEGSYTRFRFTLPD